MEESFKDKIFVTGHKGMLGSSVIRILKKKKINNILVADKKKLDLLNQKDVFNFLKKEKPKFIINCAAKVGGIKVNNERSADFIYENLQIQNNIIHGAFLNKVSKLITFGSSCIYPRDSRQPIKEEYLLSSYLEKTNEFYALAKISGAKMCEAYNKQFGTNFLCLMPTNLYGPKDNYNLETSHFIPALIKKIFFAKKNNLKSIKLWGTGKVMREVMYVDDLSYATLFFLKKKTNHSIINIGSGFEKNIITYANLIKKNIFPNLKIYFDKDRYMSGTLRKRLDLKISKSYGWSSKISFDEGLKLTLRDFNLNLKKYN